MHETTTPTSSRDLLALLHARVARGVDAGRDRHVRALYDEKRLEEREVTTFWGAPLFGVLPEEVSASIYRRGYVEERLTAFLLGFLEPGAVVFDVGAHLGYYSALAATLVGPEGRVVAFEPMPRTFALLARNVAASENVVAENAAVWSESRELTFRDYGPVWAAYASAFAARLPPKFRESLPCEDVTVRAISIDDYVEARGVVPSFVKIDAESAEMHVIDGMRRLIARHQPSLALEVGDLDVPGASASRAVIERLLEQGYEAFDVCDGTLRHHELQSTYEYDNLIMQHPRRGR